MSAYLLAKLPFGLLCWRTTRGSADDKWKWADGELLRGTYDMQTAFRSGGHIPMLAAPMLAALVLSCHQIRGGIHQQLVERNCQCIKSGL